MIQTTVTFHEWQLPAIFEELLQEDPSPAWVSRFPSGARLTPEALLSTATQYRHQFWIVYLFKIEAVTQYAMTFQRCWAFGELWSPFGGEHSHQPLMRIFLSSSLIWCTPVPRMLPSLRHHFLPWACPLDLPLHYSLQNYNCSLVCISLLFLYPMCLQ